MKRPSNLLSPVLALLAACFTPAAVMGADDPQATKPVEKAASPTIPPMVVHNPDGTVTIQRASPKASKDRTAKKGLVIPPQVVVPIIAAAPKRN